MEIYQEGLGCPHSGISFLVCNGRRAKFGRIGGVGMNPYMFHFHLIHFKVLGGRVMGLYR